MTRAVVSAPSKLPRLTIVFLRIVVQPARKKKITSSAKNSWISRCGAELVSRPSIECGVSMRDRARRLRRRDRDLRDGPVDELVEILVESDDRLERGPDLGDLGRHLRHPVGRRNDDRADREQRQQQEDDHAQAGRELGRDAAPLEPFEQRHQRDRDDQRRGHRHEEFGAGPQRERESRRSARCRRSAVSDASSRSRLRRDAFRERGDKLVLLSRSLAKFCLARPSAQAYPRSDARLAPARRDPRGVYGGSSILISRRRGQRNWVTLSFIVVAGGD